MTDTTHLSCPHCLTTNRVPSERLSQRPNCGRCRQPLLTGKPLALEEAGFGKLIANTDLPVVVDFWADWCGPCKMMAPIFAEAAARLTTEAVLVKIDTEQAQSLATRYAIRSIPSLLIFRNGREVARQAGVMELNQLLSWLRAHSA
ncbi:thioredoxin TrxC [Marinobacterium arenosum]|uniref:thioredoxin TrxC n=1 Tax=Marinobacterium arenosum TaxID=2862496 RepID=UPI001C944B44|nr:thioredoxin TrxC [Marinobacterium arenosum]MBY4677822.1 thioredoxin TrxC [Marinobacterium arenosum]